MHTWTDPISKKGESVGCSVSYVIFIRLELNQRVVKMKHMNKGMINCMSRLKLLSNDESKEDFT
jgi:hypothetical protein